MPCGLGELCVIQQQNRGKPPKDHRKPILAGHKITDKNFQYVSGCFGTSNIQVGAKMCTECARKMRKYRSDVSASEEDLTSAHAPPQITKVSSSSALGNGGSRRSASAPSWARVDDYVFEDQLRLMLDPTRDQDPEAFSFTLDSIIRPPAIVGSGPGNGIARPPASLMQIAASSTPSPAHSLNKPASAVSQSQSPSQSPHLHQSPPSQQQQQQQQSPAAAQVVAKLGPPSSVSPSNLVPIQPRRIPLKAEHRSHTTQSALLAVLADAASRMQSEDRTMRIQAARNAPSTRNFSTGDEFHPSQSSELAPLQQQFSRNQSSSCQQMLPPLSSLAQQQQFYHPLPPSQSLPSASFDSFDHQQQQQQQFTPSPPQQQTTTFSSPPQPFAAAPLDSRSRLSQAQSSPSYVPQSQVYSSPPQSIVQLQQQQQQAMFAQHRLRTQYTPPTSARTEIFVEAPIQLPPLQSLAQPQTGFLLPAFSPTHFSQSPSPPSPPQLPMPQQRQPGPLPSIQQVLNFAFSPAPPAPMPRFLRLPNPAMPTPMPRFATTPNEL